MTKIVLSYRRDDSQAATHYLFERLKQHFGPDAVFLDFDSIPYGVDFRDHITTVLHKCDVMLAMIGARWRTGGGGRNRLSEDNDWVRYEIEQAFANKIWVVPVLLDGASMPRANQLPESIRKIVYLNAISVDTGRSFDVDAANLMQAIQRGIPTAPPAPTERIVSPPATKNEPSPALSPARQTGETRPGTSSAKPFDMRRTLAIVAGVISAALLIGILVYLLYPSSPAPIVPEPGPVAAPFVTSEENDAAQRGLAAAKAASAEAAIAEKTRQDAIAMAQAADVKASESSNFTYRTSWADTDQESVVVRYQGETVASQPARGETQLIPSGLGTAVWDTSGRTCVAPSDAGAVGRSYRGQFVDGHLGGLGVFRDCNGMIIYGRMKGTHIADYAVSVLPNGSTLSGRSSTNAIVGVLVPKPGNADGITQLAGQWDRKGSFTGYGVVTCADGAQWEGLWADGDLAGPAVKFSSQLAVLASGVYGKGAGQSPQPKLCNK